MLPGCLVLAAVWTWVGLLASWPLSAVLDGWVGRLPTWLASCLAASLAGEQPGWLAAPGCLSGWLAAWLAGWLPCWAASWLAHLFGFTVKTLSPTTPKHRCLKNLWSFKHRCLKNLVPGILLGILQVL